MDRYDPNSIFRRSVFDAALDMLESDNLTEQEVCENLKRCIEFFRGGSGDQKSEVVREFCFVKLERAKK